MEHWLTKLRLKAGFETVRSLADASGVDNSTLSRIEKTGGPQPTPATLKKIAPFLKVPYIALLAAAGHLIDDPDIIADLQGPVLDHFDGDVKKALEFQRARDSDVLDQDPSRVTVLLSKGSIFWGKPEKLQSHVDHLDKMNPEIAEKSLTQIESAAGLFPKFIPETEDEFYKRVGDAG